MMRRRRIWLRATGFLLACSIGAAASASQLPSTTIANEEIPEYVVKAGFLFNLAKYVEWPGAAFATPDAPIRIGIVGRDPFGVLIEQVLKDKSVHNRHFEIQRFREVAEIRNVHILFVPSSEAAHLTQILNLVNAMPVLTVGEQVVFATRGGMVAITVEAQRPSLHINRTAVERQALAVDSKLLRVAKIVAGDL